MGWRRESVSTSGDPVIVVLLDFISDSFGIRCILLSCINPACIHPAILFALHESLSKLRVQSIAVCYLCRRSAASPLSACLCHGVLTCAVPYYQMETKLKNAEAVTKHVRDPDQLLQRGISQEAACLD